MSHITGPSALAQGDQRRMLILMDLERQMTSANMGLVQRTLQ